MWLDEDEGDGLIERELYEMVSLRQKKHKSAWPQLSHISSFGSVFGISHGFQIPLLTPEFPWSLWIWTSDIKGAGTDAQVFLQIYGEKGKSDEIKLENNSDSFEQAQLDKFMVSSRMLPKLNVFPHDRLDGLFISAVFFPCGCGTLDWNARCGEATEASYLAREETPIFWLASSKGNFA